MEVAAVVTPADILEARQIIRETHVRDEVIAYVSDLLRETRADDAVFDNRRSNPQSMDSTAEKDQKSGLRLPLTALKSPLSCGWRI